MDRRGAILLAELGKPGRAPIHAEDVAIVVAHPDDETVGCGALLARLEGAHIVLVTDGAPRDLADARAYGFASAAAYAAARRREINEALTLAGISPAALEAFGVPDQQAAFQLTRIAHRLADLLRGRHVRVALTHAYEGGHPDHDATAFAVHAAAALLAHGGHVLDIIEMPYYRLEGDGEVNQRFVPNPERPETVVSLAPDEQARKRRMIAAHKTQATVLAGFSVDAERFRLAPAYDFSRLPNDGRLLYDARPWGLTGTRWLALTRAALAALA